MPKRHNDQIIDEAPRKKSFTIVDHDRLCIECGETLKDISGKQWTLGKCIGLGGFGVIHEITEDENTKEQKYVVKIERHSNGPLFVEINCYLRIARQEMINEWKKKKGLVSLGMPNYVTSGSHMSIEEKYRFLILPRFKKDLEAILQEKKKLNLKTVLLIASQILYVLEYIHSKGYIHSDIKAANIMLDQVEIQKNPKKREELSTYSKSPLSDRKSRYLRFRTCRVKKINYSIRATKRIDYNEDLFLPQILHETDETSKKEESKIKLEQVYLLDFGLASKYKSSSGQHKECEEDQRKAHAGTLLFCSRDAHKGVQSRRSDLESLAYNMVYWLTGSLPWIEDIDDPQMIQRKKMHCFSDISGFLCFCMNEPPRVLKEIFQYIKSLNVQDCPDYDNCQQFMKKALRENGYKDDDKFDFDNTEGWGLVKKKCKSAEPAMVINGFKRPPLLSNIPIKPVLRKKIKTKTNKASLYWSRMLSNPEVLLKKVREKKVIENTELPPLDLVLNDLQPTPAMREVYQMHLERKGKSPRDYQIDYPDNVPTGYTPQMVVVWKKMMEERSLLETMKQNGKKSARKEKSCRKTSKNNNINQPVKSKAKKTNPVRTYSLRG